MTVSMRDTPSSYLTLDTGTMHTGTVQMSSENPITPTRIADTSCPNTWLYEEGNVPWHGVCLCEEHLYEASLV